MSLVFVNMEWDNFPASFGIFHKSGQFSQTFKLDYDVLEDKYIAVLLLLCYQCKH